MSEASSGIFIFPLSPACRGAHAGSCLNDGLISIRHERNVLSLPCCDLPVGRFVDRGVRPPLQKYFASVVGRNIFMSLAIPSHTEGRFAIVTDVGAGCGGRGSVLRARGSQGGSKDL